MGKGNWLPDTPGNTTEFDLVYVDLGLSLDDEHDQDDVDFTYNDLKQTIQSILGKTWRKAERYENFNISYSRDTGVWFVNGLHLIVIDTDGDFWHQGIAVVARDDSPAFAQWHVQDIGNKLWLGLHEAGYKLSRRSCAWTSTEFIPTKKEKINA